MQRENITSCPSRFCGQASLTKNSQRSGQLLISRLSVILTKTESKFGWSCAKDRAATWMSYDTRIQTRLPMVLKKSDTGNQEIHAGRPTTQSRSQCSSSDDHIPIRESGKTSLQMGTATKYELGHKISKFVGQLVRHEQPFEKEPD